jgi:hypothetical protein
MLAEGTRLGQVRFNAKFVCEVVFVFALVLFSGVSGYFGGFCL